MTSGKLSVKVNGTIYQVQGAFSCTVAEKSYQGESGHSFSKGERNVPFVEGDILIPHNVMDFKLIAPGKGI